ncbi:MAG: hypothetical protein JJU02_03805 [Cryomorphaceae bacterium]|nr:hypothetical protein [Cryomorphaceae bacterium]
MTTVKGKTQYSSKLKITCVFFILAVFSPYRTYGQSIQPNKEDTPTPSFQDKRNFIAINPIKPFIGLPNLHYEYQIRSKIGLTAFSEVHLYKVISNFDHPDAVHTLGVSLYPFVKSQSNNRGFFVNLNTSLISYFRENNQSNHLANGVQLGFKNLFSNDLFLEPKLLLNYLHAENELLPGIELMVGLRL